MSSTTREKHGHACNGHWSATYRSWMCMRARCYNPNDINYHRYGGAGISVCDRWRTSFVCFLSDMGARPNGTTLGRLGDVGNYEPGNCMWQTSAEQAKRGASNGRAILTAEQVACVRSLYKPKARRGCSAKNIAAELGVSVKTINAIVRYETWSNY